MLKRAKLSAYETLMNPTARTIIILGTLMVASLVAGAPSDFGGNGGR